MAANPQTKFAMVIMVGRTLSPGMGRPLRRRRRPRIPRGRSVECVLSAAPSRPPSVRAIPVGFGSVMGSFGLRDFMAGLVPSASLRLLLEMRCRADVESSRERYGERLRLDALVRLEVWLHPR